MLAHTLRYALVPTSFLKRRRHTYVEAHIKHIYVYYNCTATAHIQNNTHLKTGWQVVVVLNECMYIFYQVPNIFVERQRSESSCTPHLPFSWPRVKTYDVRARSYKTFSILRVFGYARDLATINLNNIFDQIKTTYAQILRFRTE